MVRIAFLLPLACAVAPQFRGHEAATLAVEPDGSFQDVPWLGLGLDLGPVPSPSLLEQGAEEQRVAPKPTKFGQEVVKREGPQNCFAWGLRKRYEHVGCFEYATVKFSFQASHGTAFDPAMCAYQCTHDINGTGGTVAGAWAAPHPTPFLVGIGGKHECFCITPVEVGADMTATIKGMVDVVEAEGWNQAEGCRLCDAPCFWESDQAGYAEQASDKGSWCNATGKLEITDEDRCKQGARAFSPVDPEEGTQRSPPGECDTGSSGAPFCTAVVKSKETGLAGECYLGDDLNQDMDVHAAEEMKSSNMSKICARGLELGLPDLGDCTNPDIKDRIGQAGYYPSCNECFKDLVDQYDKGVGTDEPKGRELGMGSACSKCDYCEDRGSDDVLGEATRTGMETGGETCRCGKTQDNKTSVSIYRISDRIAKPKKSDPAKYEYMYRGCYKPGNPSLPGHHAVKHDEEAPYGVADCAAKCAPDESYPADGMWFSIRGGVPGGDCYCYPFATISEVMNSTFLQGELPEQPTENIDMGERIGNGGPFFAVAGKEATADVLATAEVPADTAYTIGTLSLSCPTITKKTGEPCFDPSTTFPCQFRSGGTSPKCGRCHACEADEFCNDKCDFCIDGEADTTRTSGEKMECRMGGEIEAHALYQVRVVGWKAHDATITQNMADKKAEDDAEAAEVKAKADADAADAQAKIDADAKADADADATTTATATADADADATTTATATAAPT